LCEAKLNLNNFF